MRVSFERDDVLVIAERVNARLADGWNTAAVDEVADVETAAQVAVFALELAGKRQQARRGGRFGRLIVRFALAACLALSAVAAACDKPDATPEQTQTAIDQLPQVSGSQASITAQPRASPALFTDMQLLDAGSDSRPWAVLQAPGGDSPILVDRVGAGLDTVGQTYRLAAQPVSVGTRDGIAQFLDPLQQAVPSGGSVQPATSAGEQLEQRWSQDERYLAPTRAIAGHPSVLDAAYNASAAAAAGGTHDYTDGVVLRVEPDQPVMEVIDRSLLQSGAPTRAEDVVYVAIPPGDQSKYNPGQVVNLHNVAMSQQQTDVNGQPTTVYVANAALDGSTIDTVGNVDLQSLLQPRLQRVDQDLSAQAAQASGTPAPSAAPASTQTPAPAAGQPIIVQQRPSGPSFIDDFLIWMWLSNSGFYRGPSVIINNPSPSPSRPVQQVYYSPPPSTSSTAPSTVAGSQAASRSTAIEAARSAVSGQAAGTGGGVAATNKSAADASTRAGAATAKAAAVAGAVSAASAGKSTASVASNTSSSTASRSAGSTSAGTRGSAGLSSSSSSSSGGKGIGGASSSSSGGKGIGGGSSSSSGGGFGGKGGGGSSSS
jgi:hypothetical protein